MNSVKCPGGRMLEYSASMPAVMGILNCTPDSFSDGAERSVEEQVARSLEMIRFGATIIDVGGESTRPGSVEVAQEEEIARVVPVIRALRLADQKILISIDTKKSAVARAALEAGADILNDISAAEADREMFAAAAEAGAPLILMHMQGSPETMQQQPEYADVVAQVRDYLLQRAELAVQSGVEREKLILDPGFGFGKTFAHNCRLMRELDVFTGLEYPVLVGVSRKSMIGTALDLPVDQRLEGSLSLAVMSAERGAAILRVHDVKETARVLQMRRAILEG